MNGVEVAVRRPGYRLWVLILEIRLGPAHLVSRVVSVLEIARHVAPGRLLVIIRTARLQWQDLPHIPGLRTHAWISGPAAQQIIDQHAEREHIREPVGNAFAPW